MNSATLLVGRALLSVLFIVSGFGKLMGAAGFAGYLASLGIPGGIAMAYLVGALEFFGGLAILVGFQTRVVAYVLAAFTVGTILTAHMGDSIAAMKNLSIVGGFLVLGAVGAGAYSVDAKKGGATLARA